MSLTGQLSAPGEPAVRKHWLERRRATFALAILAPFVLATVLSPPPVDETGWLSEAATVAGWALFLAGAVLRWCSTLYIGGRKGTELVTDGPYSVTRNPLYLGTLLIALSAAPLLRSATFLLGMIPATAIYLYFTIRSEERRLRDKHGDAYDAYCRRTPRLWPDWRKWRSPPQVEVDLHCLRLEALRSMRWLTVPLVAMLLMRLRAEPWWPVWFDVP